MAYKGRDHYAEVAYEKSCTRAKPFHGPVLQTVLLLELHAMPGVIYG